MTQITKPRGSPKEEYEYRFIKQPTFPNKKSFVKPKDTSELCFVFYIAETERGLFVQTGEGNEIWLPISQLRNFPKNTHLKGSIIKIDISHWLLRQDEKLNSLKIPVKNGSVFVEKEKPTVNVEIKLVADKTNAILAYDPISDLDSWIPKKLIRIKGKYNFRKNKKMNINIPLWFAEKYTIGNYK